MTVYKVFKQGSWRDTEKEINDFLKDNPNLDLKQVEEEDNSSNVIVHCVFEEKKEEKKEKKNLTEELLEGLIGAVNELTDAVKTLTEKK